MPTSTLEEDCGKLEGEKKSIRDKNVLKLHVDTSLNDIRPEYKSPTSSQVLLKPDHEQIVMGYAGHDEPQDYEHGYPKQGGTFQGGPQGAEYAAGCMAPKKMEPTESYVDLSQNQRNFEKPFNYSKNDVHVDMANRTIQNSRVDRCGYPSQAGNVQHTTCVIDTKHILPKNQKDKSKCKKYIKYSILTLLFFVLAGCMIYLLVDNRSLHSRIMSDKSDFNQQENPGDKSKGDDVPDRASPAGDKYNVPPPYPTPEVSQRGGSVPLIGIKMDIDPKFITNENTANTVMWTFRKERHLSGIEYQNGYFRVNVTGFYFIKSTLSFDHRVFGEGGSNSIRVTHCLHVMETSYACENKDLFPRKAGQSTVGDSMVYLRSGQSVHVTISHMAKIYDSVEENRFTMYLQRLPQRV